MEVCLNGSNRLEVIYFKLQVFGRTFRDCLIGSLS